jgi:amidase
MYFGEMADEIQCASKVLGRKPRRSDFEATTWLLGLLGNVVSAGEFVHAMKEWHKFGRIMGEFHETYDLYLTPTMAFPPVKIGELLPKKAEKIAMSVVNFFGLGRVLKASGMVNQMAEQSLAKTPFTQIANLTGQPAMSVPLYWSEENLPIGVQFIAPIGREDRLFQLAGQLEKARPWFDKRPPNLK